MFEFYVLNYDWNRKKVVSFNVFRNWVLDQAVQKIVKKYLRTPSQYTFVDSVFHDNKTYVGFDALCMAIDKEIRMQEHSRREYEISVGDAFDEDINNYEKWDCYMQCLNNIPMIAREVVYQYKHQGESEEGLR